jgi:hypothetical protein
MIDITVIIWLVMTFGLARAWEHFNPPKGNYRL